MMAYVYLVLICQIWTRSTIVGNSAPAVDAQQLFKNPFKALINEDLSIDIGKYQRVLEHALSKVDFSVGRGIYMLPSNLNLNIGKKKGYNNKILVSNTGLKIGSSKDINRDHKKLPPDASIPVAQHGLAGETRPHNLRILNEKHNDEKLVIIGIGLIVYHFW